jgi:hypothetical protein
MKVWSPYGNAHVRLFSKSSGRENGTDNRSTASASGNKEGNILLSSHRSFIRKNGIVSELSHMVLSAIVLADIRTFNEVCEGRQSGLHVYFLWCSP